MRVAMNKRIFESITGLVIIIIACLFLWHINQKASIVSSTQNQYVINMNFNNAEGLENGTIVKISGVKVGVVHSKNLDPKTYQANVSVIIDNNIKIPDDSSAKIESSSLLGDKFLAIYIGGSDQNLKNGDQLIYTQSSISLENLISKMMFSSGSK